MIYYCPSLFVLYLFIYLFSCTMSSCFWYIFFFLYWLLGKNHISSYSHLFADSWCPLLPSPWLCHFSESQLSRHVQTQKYNSDFRQHEICTPRDFGLFFHTYYSLSYCIKWNLFLVFPPARCARTDHRSI